MCCVRQWKWRLCCIRWEHDLEWISGYLQLREIMVTVTTIAVRSLWSLGWLQFWYLPDYLQRRQLSEKTSGRPVGSAPRSCRTCSLPDDRITSTLADDALLRRHVWLLGWSVTGDVGHVGAVIGQSNNSCLVLLGCFDGRSFTKLCCAMRCVRFAPAHAENHSPSSNVVLAGCCY